MKQDHSLLIYKPRKAGVSLFFFVIGIVILVGTVIWMLLTNSSSQYIIVLLLLGAIITINGAYYSLKDSGILIFDDMKKIISRKNIFSVRKIAHFNEVYAICCVEEDTGGFYYVLTLKAEYDGRDIIISEEFSKRAIILRE